MYRRRRTDQIADHIVELERRISQLSTTSDLSEAFSSEEIRAIYDLLPQYRTLLRQELAKRANHRRESTTDEPQIA
jgi:hypothetical protein